MWSTSPVDLNPDPCGEHSKASVVGNTFEILKDFSWNDTKSTSQNLIAGERLKLIVIYSGAKRWRFKHLGGKGNFDFKWNTRGDLIEFVTLDDITECPPTTTTAAPPPLLPSPYGTPEKGDVVKSMITHTAYNLREKKTLDVAADDEFKFNRTNSGGQWFLIRGGTRGEFRYGARSINEQVQLWSTSPVDLNPDPCGEHSKASVVGNVFEILKDFSWNDTKSTSQNLIAGERLKLIVIYSGAKRWRFKHLGGKGNFDFKWNTRGDLIEFVTLDDITECPPTTTTAAPPPLLPSPYGTPEKGDVVKSMITHTAYNLREKKTLDVAADDEFKFNRTNSGGQWFLIRGGTRGEFRYGASSINEQVQLWSTSPVDLNPDPCGEHSKASVVGNVFEILKDFSQNDIKSESKSLLEGERLKLLVIYSGAKRWRFKHLGGKGNF